MGVGARGGLQEPVSGPGGGQAQATSSIRPPICRAKKAKACTFVPAASQEGRPVVPEECFWPVVPGNRGDSSKWQTLQILAGNKQGHTELLLGSGWSQPLRPLAFPPHPRGAAGRLRPRGPTTLDLTLPRAGHRGHLSLLWEATRW